MINVLFSQMDRQYTKRRTNSEPPKIMKNENFSWTLNVFKNDDTLCESTAHVNVGKTRRNEKRTKGL